VRKSEVNVRVGKAVLSSFILIIYIASLQETYSGAIPDQSHDLVKKGLDKDNTIK